MAILKHTRITLIYLELHSDVMKVMKQSTKNENMLVLPIIKTHKKVYVGDARSVTKGVEFGLFSKTKIKRNDVVFIAKGNLFKDTIEDIGDSMAHRNAIGVDPDTWLEPYETDPLRFVNHSCDPNMGIKGSVTFVALRDIRPHEHLTVDYSITECDKLWNFKIQTGSNCKCGSEKCRKVIRAIQFLPENIYKKYLPYIPTAFQKEYLKAHKLA